SWFLPLLSVMARFKLVRGTPLNVFGLTAHRRLEQKLCRDYEATLDGLLAELGERNLDVAVEIASLPEHIRGFEQVREAHIEKPPGYLMLVAADNARRALHAGFTGIVSAGVVNDNIDAELALAIEEGVVPGPRFLPGGVALDTTGDYNDTGKYWWRLGNLGAQ